MEDQVEPGQFPILPGQMKEQALPVVAQQEMKPQAGEQGTV
jgi:hypothetical protein